MCEGQLAPCEGARGSARAPRSPSRISSKPKWLLHPPTSRSAARIAVLLNVLRYVCGEIPLVCNYVQVEYEVLVAAMDELCAFVPWGRALPQL